MWKQVITGYTGLAIMLDLRAEAKTIITGLRQDKTPESYGLLKSLLETIAPLSAAQAGQD